MVFTYRPLGVDLISARNFIKFNQARTKPNSAQIAYKVAQNTITSHPPPRSTIKEMDLTSSMLNPTPNVLLSRRKLFGTVARPVSISAI